MKKRFKNLLFYITIVLCVMISFGCLSINSKAAQTSGTLTNGYSFNLALKQFANPSCKNNNDSDHTLKKIIFTNKAPLGNLVKKSVGNDVTAYYDSKQQSVYIYSQSKITFPSDSSQMFSKLTHVESIDFGNVVEMKNIQNMADMFYHCNSLIALDTKYFKNAKPTNMHSTFMGCYRLAQFDATNFDTSNVNSMTQIFAYCRSIKQLNLSKWNTSKVDAMHGSFRGMYNMKTLDLSSFNTSNVTDMAVMFTDCDNLTSINLRSFNTAKVSRMEFMFAGCESLKTLDISSFDLSSIKSDKDIESFFSVCRKLKYIYAPKKIVKPLCYDYSSKSWALPSEPIGHMILDDNKDGIADNSILYDKLPVANKSHIYLALHDLDDNNSSDDDNQDKPTESGNVTKNESVESRSDSQDKSVLPMTVTIDGITYTIGTDAKATVIKIDKIKKASLEKVTVQGVTYPVTNIAKNACKNNKKIKTMSIGKDVTSIGKNAFKGCKKLKKVTIYANSSLKLGKGSFKKIDKNATIKVKGIKGKAKKKLIKKLQKQTNATVK